MIGKTTDRSAMDVKTEQKGLWIGRFDEKRKMTYVSLYKRTIDSPFSATQGAWSPCEALAYNSMIYELF
jgi:hypothetical protein